MVVMRSPSCITASVRQELMRRPSDDHRAGAALAVIAALLGAGEMQVIAQRVEQRGARVELERVRFAVHLERELRRSPARRCPEGLRVRGEGQRAGGGGGGAGDAATRGGSVFVVHVLHCALCFLRWPYCSSVTFSIHCALMPFSGSTMA